MPAGPKLVKDVLSLITPTPQTTAQIMEQMDEPRPTARAVRYAISTLVNQERVKRKGHFGPVYLAPGEEMR